MKNLKRNLAYLSILVASLASCDSDDVIIKEGGNNNVKGGAVYAMTNGNGQIAGTNIQGPNVVVAYRRSANGTLTAMGGFPTGGNGGDFDGGEGIDPLISAYALTKTDDNENLLAVNAGSNTVTLFDIKNDFSLEVRGEIQPTSGSTNAVGPNSIATTSKIGYKGAKGLVYVSNITRNEFLAGGEPAHQGTIIGYWLTKYGLVPIPGSEVSLNVRPSAVQFSPDGKWLVVASINSGASGLASGSEDELTLFKVNDNGTVERTGAATSTLRGNSDGRNLPSAIGFQIVGDNYVVVTEAREFQSDGTPPAYLALQDGSVSTWQIEESGSLRPISLDVKSGADNTGRTACWLDFNAAGDTFYVSNALEAGLASFSFDQSSGVVALIDQTAALGQGTGDALPPEAFQNTEAWIDMWISDDGKFLYQLYGQRGTIGVYRINPDNSLDLIEEKTGNLPSNNTQGIVAI